MFTLSIQMKYVGMSIDFTSTRTGDAYIYDEQYYAELIMRAYEPDGNKELEMTSLSFVRIMK